MKNNTTRNIHSFIYSRLKKTNHLNRKLRLFKQSLIVFNFSTFPMSLPLVNLSPKAYMAAY